eukprot:NODE_9244_length_325_cov_201.257246_g7478_i0.p1 GENE.NODE_9244_length_325_cov_201.257246_g7478_i0~~NODE_9244_length_325_cov_201.257246_g7478_i0.p1  ORF type:complete len:64 (-),score=0.18 NODE_9244_length_325_cov_201.257246_g7478_i0:21-212(-)
MIPVSPTARPALATFGPCLRYKLSSVCRRCIFTVFLFVHCFVVFCLEFQLRCCPYLVTQHSKK